MLIPNDYHLLWNSGRISVMVLNLHVIGIAQLSIKNLIWLYYFYVAFYLFALPSSAAISCHLWANIECGVICLITNYLAKCLSGLKRMRVWPTKASASVSDLNLPKFPEFSDSFASYVWCSDAVQGLLFECNAFHILNEGGLCTYKSHLSILQTMANFSLQRAKQG